MKNRVKVFRVIVIVVVFCVLSAAFPLTLIIADIVIPAQYDATYYAVLDDMYEKLKSAEGKKIVIIGGSSVAFGVDSAAIERELRRNDLDYTVCNFGLYGALGTKVMLDMAEAQVSEDDIVVLAIEPEAQLNSLFFGVSSMWKCMEGDRNLFFSVAKEDRAALVGGYMDFLQERYGCYIRMDKPQPEGAYSARAFNENCDMIYERAGNAMALGYDTTDPIELTADYISGDFIEYVNQFTTKVITKKACVCMSFAPMNKLAITDLSEQVVYEWFSFLNNSFDCEVISDPWDYILEDGWFYDNNYHLNNAGAVIRSESLAKDLMRFLGCDSVVSWDLPEMPESIYEGGGDTMHEQNDAECFTYETLTNSDGEAVGVEVVGLTDSGKKKKQLYVPSEYGGLPVILISADVFAGNTLLEEITIPSSVSSIQDYSFVGCSALRIIHLLHTTAPLVIAEHPFDNFSGEVLSGLKIYVSDKAIYQTAGCMDYWSKYIPVMEE